MNETELPPEIREMGEVRALIRERSAQDDFTFLNWERNKGNTGWVCTVYVPDAHEQG